MKNIIILGSLICLLSACSRYQIHTLSSLKTPKDDQTGNFIIKNDTLEMIYKFNGRNGPLEVQIKNKLDEPLYVNWKKSALIIKDKAISFSDNKISFSGEFIGTNERNVFLPNTVDQSGKINAIATMPEEIAFIPPHAEIEKRLLNVTPGLIALAKDSLKQIHVFQPYDQSSYFAEVAKFSRENSPLVFKSYITVYLEKDKNVQVLPYQEEFYISQSVQTGKKPKNTKFYDKDRSDVFYTSEATGYGKTMAVAGGVALLGVAGAASAAIEQSPEVNK